MNQNLSGELKGVYSDHFGENWPAFNDTALYFLLRIY